MDKKPFSIWRAIKTTVFYTILCLVALTMLFPFIWMVSTSLKETDMVFIFPPQLIPEEFHWEHYINVFKLERFGRFFFNSTVVATSIVLGQLFICSLAAYAFARLNFIGRDELFIAYLATMMIPGTVTLIPVYLIAHYLNWIDTYWGLIVPGLSSVYGMFLLRQFFLTIPKELEDAARIDGCSEFSIYWRIFVPLSKPAIATLGVFTFMGVWTDFLWPLLMANSESMRTLEVGLMVLKQRHLSWYITDWPMMMSSSVVVIAPVLVVYFFTQKYYVKGIALTGMKG